jgi:CDP-diacylglycerol--glycerol-3-phosphate 3-phosphatidyltransferase
MKINFKEIFLIPNLISMFRLLLSIPFLIFFKLASIDWSFRYYIIFLVVIAFISDLLDGFIARKTNSVSEFGKIIDPLADKTLVIIIVLYLFLLGKIPSYYFYTIVSRDILIFTGGILLSRRLDKVLPSNLLGKITVLFIGFFILAILFDNNKESLIYNLLFYVSFLMSIASIVGYSIRAYEFLKRSKNEAISKN